MRRLMRPGISLIVLVGLLVGSGVAWAAGEADEVEDTETEHADTLFNFGYDIVYHLFVWNLSALDGLFECSLEGEPLTATYGEPTGEGVVPVDNLEDVAGPVLFPNRPPEELAEGLEPADAPVAYSGAEGECGLSGGEVSGPAGQVNHGMFMKLFNSLYEGAGRGCVVRHLAQSELGKGEEQVGPEGDPDFEAVVAGDTGEIEFTSINADCEHTDKKSENGTDETAHGSGRPDTAGKPDDTGKPDAPGRSESAPGHNK